MIKELTLMVGIAGSGKSTLANRLVQEAESQHRSVVLHSTDDFFMIDGVYVFDDTKLGQWHRSNQANARKSLEEGIDRIIIDNTNLTARECRPYVDMAVAAGYVVVFAEPQTSWRYDANELFKRNRHNVPLDVIKNMLARRQSVDEIGLSFAQQDGLIYDAKHKTLSKKFIVEYDNLGFSQAVS